ncbi:alpha/beta hydrolase, partial [Cellulomonas hominis]|nr:alpha/beta hydrolase [Cellulomonas hominis]
MTVDSAALLLDGPWRHHFVPANGARFHVAVAGPDDRDAPLVVLLHGLPGLWWSWRHQLPAVAADGYRVVAMDLRGTGGSDKPPIGYDVPTLTRDVAGVVRSLGCDRAVVVGHGVRDTAEVRRSRLREPPQRPVGRRQRQRRQQRVHPDADRRAHQGQAHVRGHVPDGVGVADHQHEQRRRGQPRPHVAEHAPAGQQHPDEHHQRQRRQGRNGQQVHQPRDHGPERDGQHRLRRAPRRAPDRDRGGHHRAQRGVVRVVAPRARHQPDDDPGQHGRAGGPHGAADPRAAG